MVRTGLSGPPKIFLGHLMHGGLVDDEGLDYDELRQGPMNRTVPL